MRTPSKYVAFTEKARNASAATLTLALAAGATAQVTNINGLDLELRDIFNQYPNSTLNVNGVPENSAPTQIAIANEEPGEFLRIQEGPLGNFDFGTGLAFKANTHRAWFSDDGGASRYEFQEQDAFDISVDIQINTNANSPRKEAGFFWDIGTASDPQFIVTTDNGEVAAFAGTHPKAASVGNQGPDGLEWGGALYTPGSVATLRMVYIPLTRDSETGAITELGTMEYFFNGVSATGEPLPFDDVVGIGGILNGSELSLKVQNQGTEFNNDTTDTTFIFSNLQIKIPPLGLEGDYNTDGFVSQGDLDLVLLNWGDAVAPAGFDEGNIPGGGPFDGLMSQNELDGVLLNWGNGTPPALTAIPEPATALLVAFGGLAATRRRRG